MAIYQGYLVLISTFLLNFVAIGTFNSAGLYLGPLSSSFPQYGDGVLALYCTIQIVAGLLSSLAGGIAQDHFEGGVQWIFFAGGCFMALGFVWSSISTTLLGVMAGSLLMGVGLGLGGFMAGGICVLWFEKARGKMLLLAMSGQGIGNVFFAWATAQLLELFHDDDDPWRPTMRCVGILCFLSCSIASVFMRMPMPGEVEEYESQGTANNSEEDVSITTTGSNKTSYRSIAPDPNGLRHSHHQENVSGRRRRRASSAIVLDQLRPEHHNNNSIRTDRRRSSTMLGSFQAEGQAPFLILADFTRTERSDLHSILDESVLEYDYSLRDLSFSRTNIFLNAFTLIACFAFLNMQVLLPPYILGLGLTPSASGQALVMFGIGDFLSNLTLGDVADRLGARRLLALAFGILAVLFFVWTYCTTISTLSVVAFLYGYFCCTISSMPIIILADAFSETSSEHILTLNGITNLFKFPGYLFGPMLAGLLVEYSGGSYGGAAFCSGVASLWGAVLLLMIPSPNEQHKLLEEDARKKASDLE